MPSGILLLLLWLYSLLLGPGRFFSFSILYKVGMWVNNIKTDLRDIGWDGRDWIELAQDRDQWRAFVNTVMNLLVS
jgi:hypothetical protein